MRLAEQYFRAVVMRQWSLNPVMRRIVLGGPELAGYRSRGVADEWFRFLFPADPGGPEVSPVLVGDHWQLGEPEPVSRWYTVRRWDAEHNELTVDVVVHGHGVATQWAAGVSAGDEVVISSPAGRYGPPPEVDWELIVADLTGLPAAGRIISELPAGRRAHAILEVPNEDCVLELESRADLQVSWIFNPSPDVIPSALNLATRSVSLPAGGGYVWMAGEAACSRDIRRYFRHELGWPSSRYDIVGYWRPHAEAYLKRYSAIEDEVAKIYSESYSVGNDMEDAVDQVFEVLEAHGL